MMKSVVRPRSRRAVVLSLLLAPALWLLPPAGAHASVALGLRWQAPALAVDGSVLSDLQGFKVHIGRVSGQYDTHLDVGLGTTVTLSNLVAGQQYFVAVSAYDAEGNDSGLSAELRWSSTDTNSNDLPDAWERAHCGGLQAQVSEHLRNAFVLGTEPADPSAVVQLQIRINASGRPQIAWLARAATGPGYEGLTRHYALEIATRPNAPWQPASPALSDIIAADQTVEYDAADLASLAGSCYRARVWLQ